MKGKKIVIQIIDEKGNVEFSSEERFNLGDTCGFCVKELDNLKQAIFDVIQGNEPFTLMIEPNENVSGLVTSVHIAVNPNKNKSGTA